MIIIVIPAKGFSSRLSNKNMALVNDRPMLDYAIDQALASTRAADIYVSTDTDEIDTHAAGRGVKVIRRPESLGGDTPLIDVVRHAIESLNNSAVATVVCLQADHPDRDISVDESLAVFENRGVDKLFSTEADGTKNGAHYILTRRYVTTDECRSEFGIVDDCTNVHYQEDLDRAAERLRARKDQSASPAS